MGHGYKVMRSKKVHLLEGTPIEEGMYLPGVVSSGGVPGMCTHPTEGPGTRCTHPPGRYTPWKVHLLVLTSSGTTEAGGTHPIGMHSSSKIFFSTTCTQNETILEKSTIEYGFKMI